MNGENSQNINSAAAQASQSEAAFAVPLKTGYRTYENYLLRARTIYDRAVTDFFKLSGDDPRLLDAAERWRAASVSLMRWACSFYRKIDATPEQRELALKLMDSVTKDSATRCDNVSQYYDILAGKNPDNAQALLDAEKRSGVAVIYVGEDLDVLIDLCDRILILCGGRVNGIVDARHTTKEEVGLLMTNLREEGASHEQ